MFTSLLKRINPIYQKLKTLVDQPHQSVKIKAGFLFIIFAHVSSCHEAISPQISPSSPYTSLKANTLASDFALVGVWGQKRIATDTIWVVGGSQSPPKQAIFKIDQSSNQTPNQTSNQLTKLQSTTILDGEPLWWVFGLDENKIWATGGQGTILHYNGTDWQKETVNLPPELLEKTILWGVWGSTTDNLWAVGGSNRRGGPKGLILKRDADGVWQRVTSENLPIENENDPVQGFNFYKVWGLSESQVWIIGEAGSAYFWNGESWRAINVVNPSPNEGPLPLMFTLSGDAQNIWAVGGYDRGYLWKFSIGMANDWENVTLPWQTPPLNGVFANDQEIYMVGGSGSLIYRKNEENSQFQRTFIQNAEDLTLHAVWKGHQLWIVGGDLEAFNRGVLVSEQSIVLNSEQNNNE